MRRVLLAVLGVLLMSVPVAAQTSERNTRAPGPLLIVGGGAQPDDLVQRFIDLAGGPGVARIAVLPMASGLAETGSEKVAQLEAMGAEAFSLVASRESANDPQVASKLVGVTGFWFTGGDQERLTEILVGSRLLRAIHEARAAGAAIGGTSAGAAIMPDSMITGNQIRDDSVGYYGDEFPVLAREAIQIVTGLGFLPGTIVDQHFVARERHNRLLSAVLERPSLIGLGIDESTALEVGSDGTWIVRGVGQVFVYDARDALITPEDSKAPLGAVGIRLHVLPPGATFDPTDGAVSLSDATTSR